MSTTHTGSEAAERVRGELLGTSNALVVASDDDLCPELLVGDDPGRTNLLWITYTGTPDDCLRRWNQHAGVRPANLKVLSVGDVMRSAAAARGGGSSPVPPSVVSVSNPADLTGLGIAISEQLATWAGDGNRTVACFDSLTAALQYADLQTLYKFLHVLTGRFETVDAEAHFHVDPAAHDAATVNTLKSLFDAVVEAGDDDWHVAKR